LKIRDNNNITQWPKRAILKEDVQTHLKYNKNNPLMYTEDSNTGFLGSLKSLFSVKKANHTEDMPASESTELLVEEYIPARAVNVDAPTDKPMGTRTVDYSHVEYSSVSKAIETLGTDSDEPAVVVEEIKTNNQELDILFASMLIEKGGKFIYCESINDAVNEVRVLAEEMKWAHVFCWENEIKDAFCENNFQKGAIGFTLENSNAAMCLCETLVADTGSLILSPKQASRRRLPVFPRIQIFLADTSQIAADLNKAVDLFNIKNRGELPSVLDLADNVKGHYYYDGNLVLKAEGTSEIYVFLVDEKIKPSQRS
jgi:L-lactate utilization protein LutC